MAPDNRNKEQPPAIDVLIVLAHFGTGGVERVACILANQLGAHHLRTGLAVTTADGPARHLLGADIPLIELVGKTRTANNRRLKLIRAIPALTRLLRASTPPCVLSPGNHTHLAVGIAHLLANASSTKLVVKITNPLFKTDASWMNRFLRKTAYRWLFGRASSIVVLSERVIDQVAQVSETAVAKTVFVHNPYIATGPKNEPQRPQEAVPGGEAPMLLAVGRLTHQKNYPLLLRALATLKHLPWHFVVLGDGPSRASLAELTKTLGLESRIEFKGFVSDPAVFYNKAACLVLSSLYEDLPAVLLEAMSHGCHVITTSCSQSIVDLMDKVGAAGTMVPVDDESALARAIETFLTTDKAERKIPEAINRYTFENGVREHAEALSNCLGTVSSQDELSEPVAR